MFSDDPFLPETVEQQIAHLQERAQDNSAQQQTPNLRLIQHVQQLYQASEPDSEGVNRAYQQLFQHGESRVISRDRKMDFFDNTTSHTSSGKTARESRKRPLWYTYLIAAVLLIGVLLTGTFVFAFSRSSTPPAARRTTSPRNSAAFRISLDAHPLLYQNTLYVNSGSDIRAYATRNGALERIYPLADVENPTILNGVLYASNTTSTFALRLSDGKLLWRTPFGLATPPIIVNGMLYASSENPNSGAPDKVVYALRVDDGKVLWQYRFDNQNEVPSAPLVIQGVVYFSSSTQLHQTIDARIYALKATDGSLLWHQLLGHTAISNVETDGSAFYVFVDGFVEAFHSNGRVMWHTRLPISSLVDMQNTYLAAIANGVIYVQGNGTVYALRATDGTLLWHYQSSSGTYFGSFNVQGNVLYVGMLPFSALGNSAYRPSFLLALRIDNGHPLWQKQLTEQEILNPTVEGGVIYVVYGLGNGQDALSALRTTDGHLLWTRTFPLPS